MRAVRSVGCSCTGRGGERQRRTRDIDEDKAAVVPVRNIEIAERIHRYPKPLEERLDACPLRLRIEATPAVVIFTIRELVVSGFVLAIESTM